MPGSYFDGASGVLNFLLTGMLGLAISGAEPMSMTKTSASSPSVSVSTDTIPTSCTAKQPLPSGIADYVEFADTCFFEEQNQYTTRNGDVLAMYHRLNELRSEYDLPPLVWHDGAARVAELHAKDMLRRDYFAHKSPEGLGAVDRFRRINRKDLISVAGENLAYYRSGWPDQYQSSTLQSNLEGSASHRRSMLSSEYTHAGAAIVQKGSTYMAVQFFLTDEGQLSDDWPTELTAGDQIALPSRIKLYNVGGWQLLDRTGRTLKNEYDRTVDVPASASTQQQVELLVLANMSRAEYLMVKGPISDIR